MQHPNSDYVLKSFIECKLIREGSRQHHLLSLLLCQLQSEAEPLKEPDIRKAIWNKKEKFDPKCNSIVRTEMHRLRQKLKRFNQIHAARYAFKIENPSRSYELCVTPFERAEGFGPIAKHKPAANSPPLRLHHMGNGKANFLKYDHQARHFLLRYAAALLIILCGIMYFALTPKTISRQDHSSNFVKIMPTFKLVNDSTDNVTYRHFKAIEDSFLSLLGPSDMITLETEGPTDYTLRFKGIDRPLTLRDTLTALLYDKNDQLIWSEIYRLNDELDGRPDFDPLVYNLFDDLFWISGIIPAFHANSAKLDPQARHIYSCLQDMHTYWAAGKLTHFDGVTDLLECSQSDLNLDPNTQTIIRLLRSRIYRYGFIGYIDLPISEQEAFVHAEAELDKVVQFGNMNATYYHDRLLLERDRLPQRDTKKIEALITAATIKFPNDLQLIATITSIRGIFLGDWSHSDEVFAKLENRTTKPNHIYYLHLAKALALKDRKMLKNAMSNVVMAKQPALDVMMAAGACLLSDEEEIRFMRKRLYEHEIDNHAQLTEFTIGRHMDPELTKNITELLRPNTCSLYYK